MHEKISIAFLCEMKWCGVLNCVSMYDSISEVVSRVVAERAKRMSATYIGFPPGRPNSDNIGLICAFRKYRPHYLTSCLLHTGFERFAHHLKAMDSLEKGFSHCCKEKKDVLACAEEKACIYIWVITGNSGETCLNWPIKILACT